MPRLSTDAIKQGLLHPDADVRFTALRYFAEARSRDQSVMPVVIDALKQFGRTRTFRFLHPITQLAQSESTIRWAVEELTSVSPRDEEERDYLGMITKLLCSADPRLVLPHKSDVLAAAAFDASDRRRLTNRIRLRSRTGDELWRELETICDEAKTKQSVNDVRWLDGIDIVEELARQGEQHSDRVMGLLKIRIENYEGNPHTWMEPLAVRLAGELRHEPALPLLVAKLHEDDEILSEQCQEALVKIGTDTVIQSVREEYPTAEWHFRLYSNRVFSDIHSDLAVRATIELLETEDDLDLQVWLAEACVQQLSTEGAEAAYRVLREDPDLRSLRDGLIAACTLLGEEFPELEQWRKESRDEKRHKPFMFGGPEVPLPLPQVPQPITRVTAIPKPPTPVQRTSQKVGRNDPCPCGSGKKFKKCCMAKGGGEL